MSPRAMQADSPCDAMLAKGVKDPNSRAGIRFCIGECPYKDGCVVVDGKAKTKHRESEATTRRRRVRALRSEGKTMRQISTILGVSIGTVRRCLKEV